MACPTCIVLDCANPSDVEQYSLQSGLIFTNPALGFVVNCPTGYVCADGYYPITITIIPGTITLPVPPTTFPTLNEIILILNCCQSTVSRTVPIGSTQAQMTAIAAALIAECAAQQAQCDAITQPPAPGVPPPMPVNPPDNPGSNVRVDLRNAPQTASGACGAGMTGNFSITVPAGTFGTVLWNPSATLIATTQAQLDALALTQAQSLVAAAVPPSISNSSPLASSMAGTPYSVQLNGTGGTAPYTFSIASGSLPAGLSISAGGLINGTPTESVDATFTVRITDAHGLACSKEFTIPASALCPVFIENLTDAGMIDPLAAIAASSLSKVLITCCSSGNLQIIESVGAVDTIVATNTLTAGVATYGIFAPNVGKFFINDGNPFLIRINPTTGATEASSIIDSAAPIGYNAALGTILTMWDDGGGWGVANMDPNTMGANVPYVATNIAAGYAFFCSTSSRIFVLVEPNLSDCTALDAATFVPAGSITIHDGGPLNVFQFITAAAECAGLFFIGTYFKLIPPPFTRMAVKIAVVNPVALSLVTFIDISSETLSDIEWIDADESLGLIIVKAGTKMIVINASTFEIVCSLTTSASCNQFAVQSANSRIFVPNNSSNNTAIYGH